MFYTYVEQLGNRIFHKYVKDGRKKKEVVSEFPIELFVKGRAKTDFKTLFGENLSQVKFTGIHDAKEFLTAYGDSQDIYGQTNFLNQFISNQYRGKIQYEFNHVSIAVIDLEVAYDNSGFPTPSKAAQQILTISILNFNDEEPVVFGVKEYTGTKVKRYIKCEDEIDLLKKFQRHWLSLDIDIITGWSIDGFDIPYLINRSKKVIGEEFTNRFSCFSSNTKNAILSNSMKGRGETYKILGLTALDYLELYKKYSLVKLESYRLEVVSQHELKRGKTDYSEYAGLMDLYEKNFNLFVEYNAEDSNLIRELDRKMNYLNLSLIIAYIGKVRHADIFGQVKFWDTYLYNELRDKGIQIPPLKHSPSVEIVGAYVKDPVPSLYDWILTLDLTSLYPSIIRTFNLSPETLVEPARYIVKDIDQFIKQKIDTSHLKDDNTCMIANGARFTREFMGILPEVTGDMFKQRKEYKRKYIEASKMLESLSKDSDSSLRKKLQTEVATFDATQNALKIALNSLYGACANNFFRYNSQDISEGITMTGQLIIRFISDKLNDYLNSVLKTDGVDYVVANDTDSAMITLKPFIDKMFPDQSNKEKIVNFIDKFTKTYIDPLLEKEFSNLTEWLNAFENHLSMKREVIADKGLWRGKKHYILQMWDKEGIRYSSPKLKMMGIETAKSSTPKIVRGSLEKAIRIVLNGTESELQSYVKNFKDEFFKASIQEIAFPRGVSDIDKWMDQLGNPIKKTPIHVRASIVYNQLIKKYNLSNVRPAIHNGDKIKFVYMKKENPIGSNVIGFLDDLPREFNLNQYIDKSAQFEKTFLEPLTSLTDIARWSPEKIATLADFF